MAAVRVRVDHGALDRLLRSPGGPVARDVLRRGRRVEAAARRNAPVATGRLRGSISAELTGANGVPTARVVASADYARFVHDGRGPIRGKLLAFTPRGAARPVVVRAVGPTRPNPFLRNALREAAR